MTAAILVINAGSSSLKFALYKNDLVLGVVARGEVAGIGHAPHLHAQRLDKITPAAERDLDNVANAADALHVAIEWMQANVSDAVLAAIGHRVVHGGGRFTAPVVVEDDKLAELEALDLLAPLHQPYNLAAIRTLSERFPDAVQIACFDTAFHAGWEDCVQRIAIPRRFHDAGVRRYGFHGLSYEFLNNRVRTLVPDARRVVLAHLGSGASLCAVRDGRSVDSTMGFSVLDGLPMATRCGAIDPGVVFHLHRAHAQNLDQIEHMLYYESGLRGMSGVSADMRDLLASLAPEAAQAVDVYVHQCVRAIGALTAVLGGVDALVFSGGIGWHAPVIRARVCERLGFLRVLLDATRNAGNAERISSDAHVPVFALATDEEFVIAHHCRTLLAASA